MPILDTSTSTYPINLTNVIKNSDFSIPTTDLNNIPNYNNDSFNVGITNYNGKQYGHLLDNGELTQDIDETITSGDYYVKIKIFSPENNPVSYALSLICYNDVITEPIQQTNITKSGEIIYLFNISYIPTKFVNCKIKLDVFNNTINKLLIEYIYLITPNSKIITSPTTSTSPKTTTSISPTLTTSKKTHTLLYLFLIIPVIILIILIYLKKRHILF